MISIIVGGFSYYVWFAVVKHMFDQHEQMQHILDATKKLQDVIIDGQPASEDASTKRWLGLKYLETNIWKVQTSSEQVAIGFKDAFVDKEDLLKTVKTQIPAVNKMIDELAKFKDYEVNNFETDGSKSVLKMFSSEPSDISVDGEVVKSYQYYPATTEGTALNIFTTVADKVALNQLKAALSVLTIGKEIVDSKDQNKK